MKNRTIILACCFMTLTMTAKAQNNLWRLFSGKPKVSNQFFYAKGDKIVLSYELTDVKPYRDIIIRPGLLSGSNLADYAIMLTVHGDTGRLNYPAGRHEITWDVFNDVESLPADFDFKLKIDVVRQALPAYHYFAYAGNSNAPFGLGFYRLKDWGFYSSAKFWGVARHINSTVNSDGTSDFNGIYKFGTRRRTNSYALSLGINKWLGVYRNSDVYAYFGGGFGVKQLLWERIELDGNLKLVSSEWVAIADRNYKGPLVETGINIRNKLLLIDFGIGLLDGKNFFVNFGIAPSWNIFQAKANENTR